MILGVISPTPSSNSRTFFVRLIHYPMSQESMVAMQTILPEGSLQKGIISYPGAPALARNPDNEEQPPPAGERLPSNQSVSSPVRGFPQCHPGRAGCIGSS